MRHDTDVTGVLGWGLRKYAWLIMLTVAALGFVVPGVLERAPDQYEASAQVGPVRALRLPNLDVLPRMATDVFANVPEAPEVKEAAGVPPSQPLGTDRLELVAAQDNIIFTVLARSDSPEVAQNTANVAATRFVEELNLYSQPVGSFSVNRLASLPTEPEPTLAGPLAWVFGIAAGLLAGLGAVAVLLLLRRPVIDVATAEKESGAPVLGRITLGRYGNGASGMTQVCHRILSQPTDMLLMVGPPDTRRERHVLTEELSNWLSRVRRVVPLGVGEPLDEYGSASLARPGSADELFILEDASPVEVATRPERSMTLLVVREGISRAALQEQAQQYLDGGNAVVVLVRRGSVLSPTPASGSDTRATATPAASADETPVTYGDDDTSLLGERDEDPDQSAIPTRSQH